MQSKKFRVIVWNCEKGEIATDIMTDTIVCGYEQEEDGRPFLGLVFTGKAKDKRSKVSVLKYMIKNCRRLIKIIRRESINGG